MVIATRVWGNDGPIGGRGSHRVLTPTNAEEMARHQEAVYGDRVIRREGGITMINNDYDSRTPVIDTYEATTGVVVTAEVMDAAEADPDVVTAEVVDTEPESEPELVIGRAV
eukprot:SAG31_NODE_6175_length_2136_cov_2.006873_2_plen_112_part_00